MRNHLCIQYSALRHMTRTSPTCVRAPDYPFINETVGKHLMDFIKCFPTFPSTANCRSTFSAIYLETVHRLGLPASSTYLYDSDIFFHLDGIDKCLTGIPTYYLVCKVINSDSASTFVTSFNMHSCAHIFHFDRMINSLNKSSMIKR